MILKLKKVDNGYVLTINNGPGDLSTRVYEEKDCLDDIDNFKSVLWDILDLIGPQTSRYSAKRISIDVVAGDKHE